MATDFKKLFTSLGLSATETSVYLASLKLGPTSVQDIAKKAKLSRTATYDAISALQERGLLSSVERGKKRFFAAEDPERAVAYFKESIGQMKSKLDDFSRAVPEMKMMTGGERPAVRFFEGREALYAIFNDLAKVAPKEFLEVSNLDDIYDHLDGEYLDEVRKVLNPAKIKTKILHKGKLRREARPGVEFCELLPDLGDFHGDIWIYGDRVAFVAFVGKVMAVIIESQPFADTARVLFKASWQICTTHNKINKV
jgi:HTH-type transcriptional regulator, sugar sensing transcriptional regulator